MSKIRHRQKLKNMISFRQSVLKLNVKTQHDTPSLSVHIEGLHVRCMLVYSYCLDSVMFFRTLTKEVLAKVMKHTVCTKQTAQDVLFVRT